LVVTLVHDPLRAVSVEKVDGQKQCGRLQLKGGMCLDEEVEKIRAHEPLNLGLDVNGLDVGKGSSLAGEQIHQHMVD